MASAIHGHPVKANTANSELRKGLQKVEDNGHPLLNDSEAANHSANHSAKHPPVQHTVWGEGKPRNQWKRDQARIVRSQRDSSAQRFQQLENMILSDVAIFHELMQKAHDRYTTTIDRIWEDLKNEREREYATIQQLLHNILETRVNALLREADAVAHHEAQCRGADATCGQMGATSCS